MSYTETNKQACPQCGTRMTFSGDGRALICDECGHRQAVAVKKRPFEEIEAAYNLAIRSGGGGHFNKRINSANGRQWLKCTILAVREEKEDEADYYLDRIFTRAGQMPEDVLSRAWFWMGQICDDPAEQRKSFEHALAIDPGNAAARRGIAILEGRLSVDELIDPDNLPEADTGPQTTRAKKMQCPQCAAPQMFYTPDQQALVCPYCAFRKSLREEKEQLVGIDLADSKEQDFIAALATRKGHQAPRQMRAMHCESCAADFVLPPETGTLTCPYCKSNQVLPMAEDQNVAAPDALIPFAIEEADMHQRLRAWFREHKLERPRVTPVTGVYLPVWTFDITAPLKWRAMIQERTYGGNEEQWVLRTGEAHKIFDDYLVIAGETVPRDLRPAVREFDMEHLVAYDDKYLAGWAAERYTIPPADAALQARGEIMKAERRKPRDYVGGGNSYKDFSLVSQGGAMVDSYKLIFLPFWTLKYKLPDEERPFQVVINGQSGRVYGQRPRGMLGKLFSWLTG